MQFAPDGRLFVCEQGGRLRVIKNGVLLSTPFLTVTVNSVGERGLLGVACDPAFSTNRYVYVYYTATTPAVHNRISRFTANGDVGVTGSEVIIFELNNLSGATHNGGALAFGPDGKLYAAVGENGNTQNAQSMGNLLGKMLRIKAISPDQRYDAMTHLQKAANPDAVWRIAVPNGRYVVRVVSGDAKFFDGVFRTTVEGVLTVNGRPTTSARWVEGTSSVAVLDGALTVRSATGAVNNKLCFIDIVPQ